MHRLAAAILGVALLAEPALASTLPRVDMRQGQTDLAIGAFDANLDVAVLDNLSLGVTGTFPWSIMSGGARATWRVGEVFNVAWGFSLSGGAFAPGLVNLQKPEDGATGYWVQPALNVAAPIWTLPLTVRATLGPLWAVQPIFNMPGAPLPNAELAWRLNPSNEVTLGGNALIGWRGTFGGK